MSGVKPLDQVLADAREEAAVIRRAGHGAQAEYVERLCDEVAEAAHELLAWMGETEATLFTGRTVAYLRTKFPDWQRAGHARKTSSGREYLLVTLPRRADTSSARAAGRRAAQEDRLAS